jgi:hypothetical protein
MNIILKGKILKHEETFAEHGVKSNCEVLLTVKKKPMEVSKPSPQGDVEMKDV